MTNRKPGVLLATILTALVAGGVAGAGVGLHWYPPAVGVGVAVAIGIVVAVLVLRNVAKARRARRGTAQ
jgi:hypothetical protein